MDNKYQNGKIYAVKNDITDDIYIGSTTMALSKRMVKHRSHAKTKPDFLPLTKFMNEIGIEHFYIELVEDYPCINKEHLNKREGELIRELGTLNKRVEQRTYNEWAKEYRAKHHEHILEWRRNGLKRTVRNCESKTEHRKQKIKIKSMKEIKPGNQLKLNVRVVVNIQILIKRTSKM